MGLLIHAYVRIHTSFSDTAQFLEEICGVLQLLPSYWWILVYLHSQHQMCMYFKVYNTQYSQTRFVFASSVFLAQCCMIYLMSVNIRIMNICQLSYKKQLFHIGMKTFLKGICIFLKLLFTRFLLKFYTRLVQKLRKYRAKMQNHENKNIHSEKISSLC